MINNSRHEKYNLHLRINSLWQKSSQLFDSVIYIESSSPLNYTENNNNIYYNSN